MDKTFMVFVAIGIGFLYFVTNFVGDIQEEDENYRNKSYVKEHQYDQYMGVDSVGRNVLNLLSADDATQVAAWNDTSLKDEYMALFPDFSFMKTFINERVKGESLKKKLLKQLSTVEDKFFSGTITAEQAKHELSSLK